MRNRKMVLGFGQSELTGDRRDVWRVYQSYNDDYTLNVEARYNGLEDEVRWVVNTHGETFEVLGDAAWNERMALVGQHEGVGPGRAETMLNEAGVFLWESRITSSMRGELERMADYWRACKTLVNLAYTM